MTTTFDSDETIPCEQCNQPDAKMEIYAIYISNRLSKNDMCLRLGFSEATRVMKDGPINPCKMFVCYRCGLKKAVKI